MVDNVTADAGSGGATFATDDIGGVHYPITKLTFGALDSQTIASSGTGTRDAGCQRVTIATDDVVPASQSGTWIVDLGANNDVTVTGGETPADADATPTDAVPVQAFNSVYNGTTWDLVREGGTAGSILVDGSAVTQPVSGTVTANPASGTIDTVTNLAQMGGTALSMNTGVRDAGTQRVTVATNDVVPVTGTITAVTDITNTVTVDNGGTFAVQADLGANNDVTVTGGNAHDGTTLGNPVLGGARATNSVEGITQVANADLTHVQADLNGVLLTRNGTTLEELVSERVSNTNGTSTDMTGAFAAGGANIHAYITSVTIHNAHASTNGYVDLRNGAAGGIVWTLPAPAGGGTTQLRLCIFLLTASLRQANK
jgi:hypothetical protein